jgi:hypothetical protein
VKSLFGYEIQYFADNVIMPSMICARHKRPPESPTMTFLANSTVYVNQHPLFLEFSPTWMLTTPHNYFSLMATAETNRRNPSNSAKWSQVHKDTGLTLKYIHEETEAGHTPLRDIFKGSESGLYLVRKYGQAKVNHNWKTTTTEHYNQLISEGQGDFTPEQLRIAGIDIGVSNQGCFAGANITPGSDSEDHKDIEQPEAALLGHRAPPAAVDPPAATKPKNLTAPWVDLNFEIYPTP